MTVILSRDELINNWPNCGLQCPSWRGKNKCCDIDTCRQQDGFFTKEELDTLRRENVMKYWQPHGGFLTNEGCALPVELRSLKCLKWDCHGTKHGRKE